MEYLLAFGSTHKALKAECVLKEGRVPFRLMPAPKKLVKYCDLVLRVGDGELEAACAALRQASNPPAAIYKKENDDYVKM